MVPEILPELDATEAAKMIDQLMKLKDSNTKLKYIICNKAFSNQFKPHVVNEDGINARVTLDSVCWFQYIVSPYIKEKDMPTMYLTELDLNKICGVNSTYEGTTLYIEDFLYNNIKWEWEATTTNEPTEPAEAE